MNISLNIEATIKKFEGQIKNIQKEGPMSQIFGNFLSFFETLFSRFHKSKTKTLIKNMKYTQQKFLAFWLVIIN